MRPEARTILVFAAKLALAAILIGFLVHSGTLHFAALAIFVESWWLLAVNLSVWAIAILLSTLRWRVLLAAAEVDISLWRALQLQLMALFFNIVIPGNIGGDVLKTVHVIRQEVVRQEAPGRRAAIILVPFVERLVGLAGLLVIAALVVGFQRSVFSDPDLAPLAMTVVALGGAGCLGGAILFLLVVGVKGEKLRQAARGPSRLARLLSALISSVALLAQKPRAVVSAFGLSMLMHGVAMLYFAMLVHVVTGQAVSTVAVASVFPLGMLTVVLPISPSGLGVGHVAFEQLFAAVGLTGGATVFNVFLIGQITPAIVGVVPYLSLRPRLRRLEGTSDRNPV